MTTYVINLVKCLLQFIQSLCQKITYAMCKTFWTNSSMRASKYMNKMTEVRNATVQNATVKLKNIVGKNYVFILHNKGK